MTYLICPVSVETSVAVLRLSPIRLPPVGEVHRSHPLFRCPLIGLRHLSPRGHPMKIIANPFGVRSNGMVGHDY